MPKHDHKEEAGPIFLSDGIGDISFTPDVNMEDYIQFNSEVDYGETLE